jgi:hypothetical protein
MCMWGGAEQAPHVRIIEMGTVLEGGALNTKRGLRAHPLPKHSYCRHMLERYVAVAGGRARAIICYALILYSCMQATQDERCRCVRVTVTRLT